MARRLGWLRIFAFVVVILTGIVTALFFFGYALEDPGGPLAVLMFLVWIVPVAALSWLAHTRSDVVARMLLVIGVVIVAVFLLNFVTGFIPDVWGPIREVAAVGYAIPVAFLGLKRPAAAGSLLLVTLVWMLLPVFLRLLQGHEYTGLGGPAGALVAPLLLAGLLFLADALPERLPSGTKASA